MSYSSDGSSITTDTKSATQGSTVTVTVSQGLDNVKIEPSTIKIWVKKIGSKTESVTSKASLATEIQSLVTKVKAAESEGTEITAQSTEIDGWLNILNNSADTSASDASVTLAASLPSSISLNSYYSIVVTGHDKDDIDLSQTSYYGFIGNTSGTPPTVKIESPDNLAYTKSSDATVFSGYALDNNENGSLTNIKAKLTVTDEDTGASVATAEESASGNASYEWTYSGAISVTHEEGKDKWTFTPKNHASYSSFIAAEGAGKQYLYNLEVTATASTGHQTSASISVHIDTKPPVPEVSSMEPRVENYEGFTSSARQALASSYYFLNGTITVKGSIEEQNLSNVTWAVYGSTEINKDRTLAQWQAMTPIKTGEFGKKFSFSQTVDTTEISSHFATTSQADPLVQIAFVLTAEDSVGNKASAMLTEDKAFVVCQETDRPVITLGNADPTVTSADGVNSTTNLFGTTNNNILQINLSDDDTINTYDLYIYKEDGSTVVNSLETITVGKSSATIKYQLPSDEAKYQVLIKARDFILSDTATDDTMPYNVKTVGKFFIAVDSGAPSIEISSPVAGSYQNGTISVSGSVTKLSGVSVSGKLYSVDSSGTASEITSGITIGTSIAPSSTLTNGVYPWTDTVSLPSDASGSYRLTYTASDSYGQTASTSKAFVVDITPPITSPASTVRTVYTPDDVYMVSGTISDGSATSGISGMYYRLTEPTSTSGSYDLSDLTLWSTASVVATTTTGEYTFKANIDLTSITSVDGTTPSTVYFAVKDEAGNISVISSNSDSASLKIYRDTTAPVTTFLGSGLKTPVSGGIATALADNSELTSGSSYYASGAYTLSGVVTEASASYTVKVDGSEVTADSTTNTWSKTFSQTTEGDYTHTIVITDAAGNSVTKTVTVTYDKTAPGLTITNATGDLANLVTKKVITNENSNYNASGYSDKPGYAVSGSWGDTVTGTAKLYYSYSSDGSSWSESTEVSGVAQTTASSSSFSFYIPLLDVNGTYAFKVWAVDACGNSTSPVEASTMFSGLKVDLSLPTVTVSSSVPEYVNVASPSLTLSGSYKDTIYDSSEWKDSLDNVSISCSAKLKADTESTYSEVTSGTNGYTFTSDATNGSYTISLDSATNGSWTFDLTVTDKASRRANMSLATIVDTVVPSWENSRTVGSVTYPQVGGKTYTDGAKNWFNSSALKFTGSYAESGSGIKEVKYTITPAGGSSLTGSFSTSDQGSYELFSATLDGFVASSDANTVVLTPVDNAGNTGSPQNFNIYIDSESPDLESDSSGTLLSNKTNDIEVTGTATDDASGIAGITLTVSLPGTTVGTATATIDSTSDGLSSTNTSWTATIPASGLLEKLEDGKTYSVKATVKDSAGNSTSATIFKISVDTTAPEVSISSPSTASSLNGKLAISGTVTESKEPVSLELYYTLKDPSSDTSSFTTGSDATSSWVKIQHHDAGTDSDGNSYDGYTVSTVSDISNFSYKDNYAFDFTSNSKATESTDGKDKVYILPVAKDSAGNCNIYTTAVGGAKTYNLSGQYSTFNVDINTDRPTVKVTNLTKSGSEYFLKYGTNAQISGSLSDDDATSTAVVTKFVASGSVISIDSSTGKIVDSSVTGTTTFDSSSGEWSFTPASTEDGTKEVYFYMEDNAGGIFYTGKTVTIGTSSCNFYQPYFQYKTSDPEDNSSSLTYKSDSKSPVISSTFASDSGTDVSGDETSSTGNSLLSSYVVGGSAKNKIKFTIIATDASGIAGLTADLYYTVTSGSTITTEYVKNLATGWTDADGAEWTSGTKYIGGVSLDESSVTYTKDSTNWAQTTSGNDTSWTWTTSEIDLSSVPTGSITLNVTPYDKAGLTGNQSYTFSVDNSGPGITVTQASAQELTGEISLTGTATDTGSAGTYDIRWIVPTKAQVTTANAKSSDAARLAYLKSLAVESSDTWSGVSLWNGGSASLDGSASTVNVWQFDFDGEYSTSTSSTSYFVFKNGNPKFDLYDSETFASNSDYTTSGIYNLPVYFMAIDNLGNYTIKEDFYIRHNPDGDKPKVEFTYPTTSDYDVLNGSQQSYITLGGAIRLTGSAIIPSGTTTVKAVYIQVADSSAGFTGTSAGTTSGTDAYTDKNTYGLTLLSAYEVLESVLGSAPTVTSDTEASSYGFASKAAMDAWWGIAATGSASWNIALNSDEKMNPAQDSSETNNITVRACGVNAEGKFGAWTDGDNIIAIHIDDAAPTISSAVNQYSVTISSTNIVSDNAAIASSASKTYSSDMYLKGNWYLVLDVLDESGIGTLVVKQAVTSGSSTSTTILQAGSGYYYASINNDESNVSKIVDSTTSKKGKKVYIPIDISGTSVKYTISATDTDASAHTTAQEFSFNIDNTAPTLTSLKGNGTAFDSSDFDAIEDNNYQFILSGASTDEGSGVQHVLFYYMRKKGTTGTITDEVVMDPMITTGTDDSKVAMTSLTERTFTQGTSSFSLYAKAYEGTATTETFTSSSAYDAHVRVGGVVEIDGILHTISDISGTTVTFSPSLTAAKTDSFTAYFPIAQVIDNSAIEKVSSYSANPFTFEKGDDGDTMPESFSKSGKTWTWDATIHSTNMPDGPASLVILAFDNAGNVAGKTIKTKISNNAPRVAKVFLGTDLSGDGKYVNSSSLTEIVEYDILGAEGATQKAYTLDFEETKTVNGVTSLKYTNGIFKIKNGLAVIPELTGGNGDIGMILKTGATDASAVSGTVTAATSSVSNSTDSDGNISASFTGTVAGSFEGSNASYTMHAFTVASGNLGSDGTGKGMSFTFWDSTEETSQGSTSQNAVLYVKNFTVAQSDTTKPTVVVNPFYWNSSSSNSLYSNSSDNGHIELESDLTDAIKTAYGNDPKVSGKITFTGTAYDDTRLASLSVSFGDFLSTATSVARYNSTSSTWTVESKTMAADGYEFTVTDATSSDVGNYSDSVYFDQKGHKVYWTLSIDTSKISKVAATDVNVTVTATDAKDNATDTSSIKAPVTTSGYTVTDGTTNYPIYQMDVVPYITGLTTNLSSLKTNNPSVYARTAMGHYSVYYYLNSTTSTTAMTEGNKETFTIKGFNLSSDSPNEITQEVTSSLTSGNFAVTVNEISSLNNINSNDAKGAYTKKTTSNIGDYTIYSNYYNRQPNNDNNNNLTDDVYLDVWQINQSAGIPVSGKIDSPVMKIQPSTAGNTGLVGVAFGDGPLHFSMPGRETTNDAGTFYSYNYWVSSYDFVSSAGMAFDSEGRSYALAAGGDINTNDADKLVFMTDRWGHSSRFQKGTYNKSNSLRIDAIGQYGTKIKEDDLRYFEKYKFKNPCFATTRHDSSTNVYLVYYDALNDEIRFKYGNFSDTQSASSNFGDFVDSNQNSNLYKYTNDVQYVNVIAEGYNKSGATDSRPKPGEFASIAVIPGTSQDSDVVVMVWYDETNNALMYTYNETPATSRANLVNTNEGPDAYGKVATTGAASTTLKNGWIKAQKLLTGAGEYCKIEVDAAKHIHIAAYDNSDANVKYIYIDTYIDYSNAKSCIVDSYGITGSELTLDVAMVDGNPIPYIGYYSQSCIKPKYAYYAGSKSLSEASESEMAGSTGDMYTGVWESTLVPTINRVPADRINVGIWKNSSGVRTESSSGISYYEHDGSTYGATSRGKIYGNGSKNGIIVYERSSGANGYIETAQMK